MNDLHTLHQQVADLERAIIDTGHRASSEADWNPAQARFLRQRMWDLESEATNARIALCEALAVVS